MRIFFTMQNVNLMAVVLLLPMATAFRPPTSLLSATSRCVASSTSATTPLYMQPTGSGSGAGSAGGASSSTTVSSEASKQNIFGVLSDAATGAAFSLLHAFDDCGIEDSSKNLRVLWVRALLNTKNQIDDEVAAQLLPPTTRSLVTTPIGAKLFDPILKFTEWIQARTEFIDTGLERFLSSPVCTDAATGAPLPCNVVLCGAGYDTRALRYRHRHDHQAHFFELDLPSVVSGKQRLYQKFQKEIDPTWKWTPTTTPESSSSSSRLTVIPLDFNDCGSDTKTSLIGTLKQYGLRDDIPTLFVWEAVLFYVNQDAVTNIMEELFDYAQLDEKRNRAETMLCFTDSLKPFVDVPFTNEATKFFASKNLDLLEHRSRWGGAVHFALASTRGPTISGGGSTRTESAIPTTGSRSAASDADSAPVAAAPSEAAAGAPASVLAATSTPRATRSSGGKKRKKELITGMIGKHISAEVGGLVNSYLPTQANNVALLETPGFDNCWYAIGYTWQIDGYENAVAATLNPPGSKAATKDGRAKPFATRLWGEPIVVYRDENDQLTGLTDVCPHRSAPLSMGTVENGQLVCFYHGWKFGQKGECTDIPTLRAIDSDKELERRSRKQVTNANCGNLRAVADRDGIVYVWRGNILEANTELLPYKRRGDMESVTIDSVLDYAVDYSYIVENNLDSPHLFYLHDGSVPPIEDIGLMNKNLAKLQLTAFTDDCGFGHLGKLGKEGRPKKLIRFDPPNIVRHGGVSGFEEEFHIIPIAPYRTRVLMRQHLPKGPILSTVTSIPLVKPALTALVNSWNYHIGLEDAAVMQGQAHRIEDWGAPRMSVGGLGDDLIKRYWKWRKAAHEALPANDSGIKTPYYTSLGNNGLGNNGLGVMPPGIPTGTAFADTPAEVERVRAESRRRSTPLVNDDGLVDAATGNPIGSWGIKQNYVQNTPAANFPPMNYKRYANLLVFDDLVKKLFAGKEPSSTMIKTQMADVNTKGDTVNTLPQTPEKYVGGLVASGLIVSLTDVLFGGAFSRSAASTFESIATALPAVAGTEVSLEQRMAMTTMLLDRIINLQQ